MHAYLIIGGDDNDVEEKINNLVDKFRTERMDYEITKIEDVRVMADFTKLTLTNPTAIIIKEIDKATEEALNAFLKSLEEPQKSLYYILTAKSDADILSTIISRCSLIYLNKAKSKVNEKYYQDFLESSISEKFILLDKIKDRNEAIKFIEEITVYLHNGLIKNKTDYAKFIKTAQDTRNNLKANGNVNLQLTNFAIQISKNLNN